jgi:predicted metal-dependent hydrolase
VSKKSAKIAQLIAHSPHSRLAPHYAGYMTCFNQQHYYEAHDVLEELWLAQGPQHPDYAFAKGLIQGAGAFVHLQLQHRFPAHHVHRARLAPAGRLLHLALHNLQPYPSPHLHLDLRPLRHLWQQTLHALEQSSYQNNPWHPDRAPLLPL